MQAGRIKELVARSLAVAAVALGLLVGSGVVEPSASVQAYAENDCRPRRGDSLPDDCHLN